MNSTHTPTRAGSFAATATTVVALLAIASAARIGPVGESAGQAESRTTVRESSVVRAVAEVMAAAARDLARGEHATAALSSQPSHVVGDDAPPARSLRRHARLQPLLATLDERLIDLPPPAA